MRGEGGSTRRANQLLGAMGAGVCAGFEVVLEMGEGRGGEGRWKWKWPGETDAWAYDCGGGGG